MMRALVLAVAACGAHVAEPAASPPAKSIELNPGAAMVDVDAAVVPGFVTVVDFWSASCGACTVLGGMLAVGVAQQDRVVIRKVDVGDGFTQVAKANRINALPHFRVYDAHRRLRYDLVGNDCLTAPDLARALAAEP
jgi:hypothetical protein